MFIDTILIAFYELLSKLFFLSSAEVGGIPGVAVECDNKMNKYMH